MAGASEELGVTRDKVMPELQKRLSRIKELEKQLNTQRMNLAVNSVDAMIAGAEIIADKKVIAVLMQNADMSLLRKTLDMIKAKAENTVIALGAETQGRALLVMGLTEDLVKKGVDASLLITEVAKVIGGSGGGRKDFAQAGGIKPENFSAAFDELKKRVAL